MPIKFEEGVYPGEITGQGISKSNSGNWQIVLNFKILDGSETQRTIYYSLTDKTVDFVAEALRKIGFEGDGFSQIDLEAPGACDIRGMQGQFYCKHQEYNGKWGERWSISRGPADTVPAPAAELKKLDQMFSKALRSRPRAAAASAQRAPQTSSMDLRDTGVAVAPNPFHQAQQPDYGDQGITDDDIPF